MAENLTLPEIAKYAKVEYRTLKSWVDRGFLGPVPKKGAGRPHQFNSRDAEVARALGRWRKAGLEIDALAVIANELQKRDTAICPVCGEWTGIDHA